MKRLQRAQQIRSIRCMDFVRSGQIKRVSENLEKFDMQNILLGPRRILLAMTRSHYRAAI